MLKSISIDNKTEWDQVVKSFGQYDVYWLNGYIRAFQLHGDGEPQLLYFESDGTRGINVVMKRDIAKDPHFSGRLPEETYWDYSSPYGYGGWLIEGDGIDELDKEYISFAREHNIVSEFVRFHPMIQNQEVVQKMYDVVPLGNTVAMELQPQECIWENITSKNRNVIRKAEKNGVTIQHGLNEDLFQSFREIYNQTMDKDAAESYYYFEPEFYGSILNDLKDNAQVFYAVYEGQIIAASIMIYANGYMNYHLSGSMREYSSFAATNLLLFEAAKWGSEQGFRTLYLGGGVGSGEDSLFKFKQAFYRGDLHRFHIGKKVFNQEVYDRLVQMRENLPESGYFPRYRA